MDVVGEGAEEREDVDDLGGVRRKLGLVGDRGELRRGREIERERDVLGEVEAAVGEGVLADVGAEGITAGAGCGGGSDFGVDLVADLVADRGGGGEVGVVTAGVECGGNVEERLARLEGDGGAACLRLSDMRSGLYRDVGGRGLGVLLLVEAGFWAFAGATPAFRNKTVARPRGKVRRTNGRTT